MSSAFTLVERIDRQLVTEMAKLASLEQQRNRTHPDVAHYDQSLKVNMAGARFEVSDVNGFVKQMQKIERRSNLSGVGQGG